MGYPEVDVVITFRTTKKMSLSKQQIREDSRKADLQYTRLIETLKDAGLRAVGRRGEALGHLLIFVSCPPSLVFSLVKHERNSDFLSGLPITPLAPRTIDVSLSSAERLRLVHAYITSPPTDGGLGIIPQSSGWDLVESVMALHDREFNEIWVRRWSLRDIASIELEKIRAQFGDSVAFYYAFLASYTKALVFPASLGVIFYFFGTPYSPIYSTIVFIWSVVFVEWWRVHERVLSLKFGTRGSFSVEQRRGPSFQWWKRELRMVASLPILLLCAAILVVILTGIFLLEAFVTKLYTGPGHDYISFSPTILFVALVPRFLGLYQVLAQKLTAWENHTHRSSYAASLTLKTFALSALVAYLGLGLTAFLYVPFGEIIMQTVQNLIFHKTNGGYLKGQIWDMDTSNAKLKVNPNRLREQMFAYTVTNQVVDTFSEVGLPFILRAWTRFSLGKKGPLSPGSLTEKTSVKKRVVFEDEKEKGGMEEREFLDAVRAQVALPEYELFKDYSEMVTQFGYVALWSTVWPLAPVMALLNNFLELRSDAFKMTTHNRRPIPIRTDTIGPWLEALTFLTWLSAVTNSALVYLFSPHSLTHCPSVQECSSPAQGLETKELMKTSLWIALAASHAYIIVRAVVRHITERVFWKGSAEIKAREREERDMKEKFLTEFVGYEEISRPGVTGKGTDDKFDIPVEPPRSGIAAGFWQNDEGLDEILRISKEV